MKNSLIKILVIWIISTLALNYLFYLTIFIEMDTPVYLTREERADTMIIFWRFLPGTAELCGGIVGVGYLLYKFVGRHKNN